MPFRRPNARNASDQGHHGCRCLSLRRRRSLSLLISSWCSSATGSVSKRAVGPSALSPLEKDTWWGIRWSRWLTFGIWGSWTRILLLVWWFFVPFALWGPLWSRTLILLTLPFGLGSLCNHCLGFLLWVAGAFSKILSNRLSVWIMLGFAESSFDSFPKIIKSTKGGKLLVSVNHSSHERMLLEGIVCPMSWHVLSRSLLNRQLGKYVGNFVMPMTQAMNTILGGRKLEEFKTSSDWCCHIRGVKFGCNDVENVSASHIFISNLTFLNIRLNAQSKIWLESFLPAKNTCNDPVTPWEWPTIPTEVHRLMTSSRESLGQPWSQYTFSAPIKGQQRSADGVTPCPVPSGLRWWRSLVRSALDSTSSALLLASSSSPESFSFSPILKWVGDDGWARLAGVWTWETIDCWGRIHNSWMKVWCWFNWSSKTLIRSSIAIILAVNIPAPLRGSGLCWKHLALSSWFSDITCSSCLLKCSTSWLANAWVASARMFAWEASDCADLTALSASLTTPVTTCWASFLKSETLAWTAICAICS